MPDIAMYLSLMRKCELAASEKIIDQKYHV